MELNCLNYKKAMDKIAIPQEIDDKVIRMFEGEKSEVAKESSKQKHKKIKKSGKILLIAAALVVLSCASVFAYNTNFISNLINPARGLDHSDNVDVNGNLYAYTGGETLAQEVKVENLSITLSSVISDGNLTYIRFNVTSLNGDSLCTNTADKKSVLSMQQFGDIKVLANNEELKKTDFFMFRVDSGDKADKAVLELTIQNANIILAGKKIDIVGTDYADTYEITNDDGSFKTRKQETLYKGTWNFTCDIPSDSVGSVCEYTDSWGIPFLGTTLNISSIKISDVEVFLVGTFNCSEADNSYSAGANLNNKLYLIYADGTRIAAGVKMEGGQNFKTGVFDRHYMLQNLIDAKNVVAIEYSGNLINLK